MPKGVYKRTEAYKRKLNERMKGNKNPAKRPEVRKKISERSKRLWQDPEFRKLVKKKQSEYMKRQWKDSVYREKISKLLKGKKNPGLSEYMKKKWRDPRYREVMTDGKAPIWRGGKTNYWRRKSRKVWQAAHGQKIPRGMIIHHIDEDETNIDPKNLQLRTRSGHVRWHHKLKKLICKVEEILERRS